MSNLQSPSLTKKIKNVKIDYNPHLGQLMFHTSTARFRIVCCGRKWGKTTMLVNEAFRWLGRPDTLVWWVAPYHNVAKLGWRRFKAEIPPVVIAGQDKRDARLDMINGSQIWFKSADNPDGLVGEGIDLLIIDEASRVKEIVWLETLYPNLDDPNRIGHMACASTPKGYTWFFKDWLRGIRQQDGRDAWGQPLRNLPITNEPIQDTIGGWPSWNSPYFKAQSLEAALKLPKLVFMQEYGARFLKDLGAVFTGIIEAATLRKFQDPDPTEEYYMGVDLAKTQDFTVLTIINSNGEVVYWDRFRNLSWPAQVRLIINKAIDYNDATMMIDSTGLGDPVYDFMKIRYSHVQGFKITNQSKREIIENLKIAIQTKRFTYPEIPELMEELSMFGASNTTAGKIRYEAPKGFHDDCVISAALAAWLKIKAASMKLSFEFYDWD